MYVLIRQLVNTKEWLIACEYLVASGLTSSSRTRFAGRGRKGMLRRRLRSARTYQVSSCRLHKHGGAFTHRPQEWKDAAMALDEYLHFDEWKTVDEDPYYDWKLVRKVR